MRLRAPARRRSARSPPRPRRRAARFSKFPAPVLEKITRRENPQSVVGVFRQRFAPETDIGSGGIWVALDRVRDPGNLGTIVRTADAAGLTRRRARRRVLRSVQPRGSARDDGLDLSHAAGADVRGRADRASEATGARLIGTHLTAAAIDYREADYSPPLILLMGNEQQGLTEKLAAACDALVRIPMRGKADSLNLAVSTGLMIYEVLRHDQAV